VPTLSIFDLSSTYAAQVVGDQAGSVPGRPTGGRFEGPQVTRSGTAGNHPNWRWRSEPIPPGPAVVFDIDGVLSDAAGRQHFIESHRRDWDAFFDACGEDPLVDDVARLLGLLEPSLGIVLLTGRPIRVMPQTLAWLSHNALRWDLLVMRDRGDYAHAASFKRRSVTEFREYGMDLRIAFEDDPRNRDMFRSEGVPCIYIHSGYYD
jgi:hypothetical protein